ncbi:carboxymuconolactone decarboxylase family protein [Sphingomonadaceae bacterium G21617-S1]|jgi:4-carboxymuconolactone decarboxylase|uniref:Carboxymuconolactone decarboxylase family protein n=2 Tax=Alphaproteobacteria TaxID=28211 RepID=A0ABU9Z8H8_9HYPH|nr:MULTISPECIES: carboxymuconolactone decarboxylase family protein [Alphaproteobacteria]MBY0141664.1 carboxymuconolactone decarboxylase family protein [Methylorubrum populi]MCH4021923.1 carboxymuconolactone decarboxylase family protein [Acetobacter sp.]MCZ4344294.1 carboxymuconolactone decarboxylase family protein [Sphingomonadaceae bacterium G21617-S1]MBK3404025.1 carboxymuconolactone decarboxylase family protein [Methylorubrum rhodesianum]MCH4061560.1 carboxymuconolactone decarboxylase famil
MVESSPTTEDRFSEGKVTFEKITGLPANAFLDGLENVAPAFGRFVMEWEFADVYGSSSLDLKTRETIMIAACAALGATAAPILKLRIGSALRAGVSRQEIIDICIQVGIPAGLPAALSAIQIAGEVFAAVKNPS